MIFDIENFDFDTLNDLFGNQRKSNQNNIFLELIFEQKYCLLVSLIWNVPNWDDASLFDTKMHRASHEVASYNKIYHKIDKFEWWMPPVGWKLYNPRPMLSSVLNLYSL